MRFAMIIGVVFAACAACSTAPSPSIVPPAQRIEHVQSPSKLDVKREMEYRQLKAALDKAQKAMEKFDSMSAWGP